MGNPNPSLDSAPGPYNDSPVSAPASPPATLEHSSKSVNQLSRTRLWLHRLGVLLFVFFCASLGVILVVFPWRDEWTNNVLLAENPGLAGFMGNGFVRGLCSGLGLVDIWIGFWEAVHYHE